MYEDDDDDVAEDNVFVHGQPPSPEFLDRTFDHAHSIQQVTQDKIQWAINRTPAVIPLWGEWQHDLKEAKSSGLPTDAKASRGAPRLTKAGVHTTWSYVAMVASVVVGTASAAFVGWVFSVRIDAADTMTPEPEITRFGGTALLLVGLCVLVFVASAIFAAVRQSKINREK